MRVKVPVEHYVKDFLSMAGATLSTLVSYEHLLGDPFKNSYLNTSSII